MQEDAAVHGVTIDTCGVDWYGMITDTEFRRRFHHYAKEYVGRRDRCVCDLCGALPGDTIYFHDEFFGIGAHRMIPATEHELSERGYRGKNSIPNHFWD